MVISEKIEVKMIEEKYVKYFAYCSNMDQNQMVNRGVIPINSCGAKIEGYELKFNKQSFKNPVTGVANICETPHGPDDIVQGILYTIKESDIDKLDKFEGYLKHYNRVEREVIDENEDEESAIIYIAQTEKISENLKPTSEYMSHLIVGSGRLDDDYRKMLKNVETIDQPIRYGLDIEDQVITFDRMKVTYIQEGDCESPDRDTQELELFLENCLISEEESYIVMKTDRWAFDSRAELIRIIDDFLNKAGVSKKYEKD